MPSPGQLIKHDGKTSTTIKEGLAHILVPADAVTSLDTKKSQKKELDPSTKQSVFYNPIQQFNRDLSVLAIRVFANDLLAIKAKKNAAHRLRQKAKKQKKAAQAQAATIRDAESTANGDEAMETSAKRKASEAFADEKGGEGTASKQAKTEHEDSANAPRPQFKILDALSATGLRALRYAHELSAVTQVTANDLSHDAVESMKLNVQHNRLDEKIKTNEGNAIAHMYEFVGRETGKYDVVDLDPYGTAVPFLDAALNAINDGGLLCVTCTDAGVWASVGYPEKAYALYGGVPIKGNHSHEGGLRLILNSVAQAAGKMGISIEPLLSLSIDFYARVFVRVRKSPADTKFLLGKTMMVYSCDSGCGSWQTQPLGRNVRYAAKDGRPAVKHGLAQGPQSEPRCAHCGFKTHVSGPMWGGPLHNPHFLKRILELLPQLDKDVYGTVPRIEGMVSTALEELEVEAGAGVDIDVHANNGANADVDAEAEQDERPVPPTDLALTDRHPFYFSPSQLSGVLHCQAPSERAFKGALRHAGYIATRSHVKPAQIRTNAPWSYVWQVMREWIRQRAPLKEGALTPNNSGYGIMFGAGAVAAAESPSGNKQEGDKTREVVFDEELGRETDKKKLLRYQLNPRENWGPMSRAKH